MKCLTREEFLKRDGLERVAVELSDGEGVFVRMLTGEERSNVEKRALKVDAKDDPGTFRWLMIQATTIDAGGRQLFTKDDRPRVMALAADTIEKLFEASCKLNGLTDRDVEDLEKNSAASR